MRSIARSHSSCALAEVPRLVELLRGFQRGFVLAGQCVRVRAERQAEGLEVDPGR
jgi:hypothetical protein